jgi:hypothetical protein
MPAPRGTVLLAAILPLLAHSLGAGCSGEKPLGPAAARPEYAAPPLVLEAGGVEIARITDPVDVEALVGALPAPEQAALHAAGSCTTRDPAFRAALARWSRESPDARGGFAGQIRNRTWGEIKVRFQS